MTRAQRANELARATTLPSAPANWRDLSYAITNAGQLAILRTDRKTHDRIAARLSVTGTGRRARISVFDGRAETDLFEFALEGAFPVFDRLADGRWIVADARCGVGFLNARLLSEDGRTIRKFCLGDGIEHLQCDSAGSIWVGYFDEGIYGNLGWGMDGPDPIGVGGLIRFDDRGQPLWQFSERPSSGRWISDCYALNVAGSAAWLSYYTDFPIARVSGGKVRSWSNTIHGARALAVAGDHVLLAGGYSEDMDRLALVKLGDATAELVASSTWDRGQSGSCDLVQGRGDTLHLVMDDIWYRINIATAVRAWASD